MGNHKADEQKMLKVCEIIATSHKGVHTACKEIHLGLTTFYNWLDKNPEYKKLIKNNKANVLSNRVKGQRANNMKDYRINNARETNKKRFGSISHIYVIQMQGTDLYKIGVSNKPSRRLRDIESCLPYGIVTHIIKELPDAYAAEAHLHNYFASNYLKSEWFKLDHNAHAYLMHYINTL